MATSRLQYELRVNCRVTKPHFYWSSAFKAWVWNVSDNVILSDEIVELCAKFSYRLNATSRPI